MTIEACPGGADHQPTLMQISGKHWVECQTCGRESYAVQSATEAVQAWASSVGQKGRSNLISHLKATS
jgi:ribosomal protein L37E